VNAIIEYEEAMASNPTGPATIAWWRPEDKKPLELVINEFVGQGRRLRHCGVTNTVLEHLQNPPPSITKRTPQWLYDDRVDLYTQFAQKFEDHIIKRPRSWWVCWACGGTFVSIGVFMAMAVSFNTPTIGLGCRSLLWLVFWLVSSLSWLAQAAQQEPHPYLRRLSIFVNTLSFLLLLAIMFLQVGVHPLLPVLPPRTL
jgi:hypothetical protein